MVLLINFFPLQFDISVEPAGQDQEQAGDPRQHWFVRQDHHQI